MIIRHIPEAVGTMVAEDETLTPSLGFLSEAQPILGRHRSSMLSEYESIGLTVLVDQGDHQPLVMHDFTGPILTSAEAADAGEGSDQASLVERLSSVIDGDVVAQLEDFPPSDIGGTATIPSEIASMSKNLIGCGALSLCNGIARAGNSPTAVWAANVWILLFGFIFGYFCWLIAKVCQLTGRTTYRGIWEETVGHKGSLAVSVANALKAAMADLAYATILSDTLKSLLQSVGFDIPRVVCLILITLGAILPLCLLKNLQVLAPFSIVGTAGVLFTAGSMLYRYLDGSYQPGGKFYDDLLPLYRPNFGNVNESLSTSILPFVCMVYEAYVMHYNSARFYTELKDRSLPRFGVAVGSSFGISAVLYMAIATFGFLTFGGNSAGFILNNYSPYDPLANISRIAVGISVLTAYPIVFFGVRDGCLDMFEVSLSDQTPEKLNSLTLVLLTILTVTAVLVTDLGLINAVGGGLVATAIVFVFPTLMFYKALKRMAGESSRKLPEFQEVYWATLMTLVGVVIGLVGAYTAVAGSGGGPSTR